MRRMTWKARAVVAFLLLAMPMVAQQSPINPKAVAILRWYPANLTTFFSAGQYPAGLAFDGANIWVTNNVADTVQKRRASDGQLLGTFPVGSGPCGVAFDGANIWTANNNTDTVTKLRASDGHLLGTYTVGPNPWRVRFDGANIWTTNLGTNTVSKLRASDGHLVMGPSP